MIYNKRAILCDFHSGLCAKNCFLQNLLILYSHFVIKYRLSTFDLRFALLVPLQSENASYAPALCELTICHMIHYVTNS